MTSLRSSLDDRRFIIANISFSFIKYKLFGMLNSIPQGSLTIPYPSYHNLGRDVHYIIAQFLNTLDLSNLSLTNKYHNKICNKIAKNRLLHKKYKLVPINNYIQILSVQIDYDWMNVYDHDDSVNMFEFCLLNIKYLNMTGIMKRISNIDCIKLVIRYYVTCPRHKLIDLYSSSSSCYCNKTITQYIIENYRNDIDIDDMLDIALRSHKANIDKDTVQYLIHMSAKIKNNNILDSIMNKCDINMFKFVCDIYPYPLDASLFTDATLCNRLDILEYLMIKIETNDYKDCINLALTKGYTDVFIFWMDYVNTDYDIFSKAIYLKHIDIIKYLLYTIPKNKRPSNFELLGYSYNSMERDVDVFKCLIENGVTLKKNKYHKICGKRPVCYSTPQLRIVLYLISIGATDIEINNGISGNISGNISVWSAM